MAVGQAPAVERGREAAARESWAEAYALLSEADRHPDGGTLTPDDLDVLSDAAWWSGHIDESVEARVRAHAGFTAAGNRRRAGYAAWWLYFECLCLGRPSAAAGWLRRARRHLEPEPECPEQCLLAWTDAEEARARHDPAAALAAARRMHHIARRVASPDLIALSRQTHSAALLAEGRRSEGFGLLDDAMCAVTAGELSSMFTGWLYCMALTECMEAADLGRAREWTDAAMTWCTPPGAVGFHPFRGLCRVHHVEVLDLLGEWELAEAEARRVCAEVAEDALDAAAGAHYAAGEIQRRQGRRAEAEASYAHAHELGRTPQPGLALLRLAEGRPDAAAAGLRSAEAGDLLGRARLLAARTEVALAVGDVPEAAAAVEELEGFATGTPLLSALTDTARGALALARQEPALRPLRRALAGWLGLRVPYEAAQVRMLLAAAQRAEGDDEAARLELEAARTVFARLGATPDARRASALAAGRRDVLTPRETEVLRLVAAGGTNRDIAKTLVISEHTVARHLNNIFAKLNVTSRAAATSYAYAHGLT